MMTHLSSQIIIHETDRYFNHDWEFVKFSCKKFKARSLTTTLKFLTLPTDNSDGVGHPHPASIQFFFFPSLPSFCTKCFIVVFERSLTKK